MATDDRGLAPGMVVRSADGAELGRIVERDGDALVLEKGFFFPRTYRVDARTVERCADGEVWLSATRRELEREPAAGGGARSADEVRVPVVEEELVAERHVREMGAVRIRKRVVTEVRQISVPVRREELSIERVEASGGSRRGGDAFDEGGVEIPLYEEEIEIVKRPRVREIVRVTKTVRQEERRVEGDVRRTIVEVDEDEDDGRGLPH